MGNLCYRAVNSLLIAPLKLSNSWGITESLFAFFDEFVYWYYYFMNTCQPQLPPLLSPPSLWWLHPPSPCCSPRRHWCWSSWRKRGSACRRSSTRRARRTTSLARRQRRSSSRRWRSTRRTARPTSMLSNSGCVRKQVFSFCGRLWIHMNYYYFINPRRAPLSFSSKACFIFIQSHNQHKSIIRLWLGYEKYVIFLTLHLDYVTPVTT